MKYFPVKSAFQAVLRLEWIFVTTFVRYRQFLAAFSAASSQYAATVSGHHSFTETVLVTSFTLRWLKCSFHLFSSFGPSRAVLLSRNTYLFFGSEMSRFASFHEKACKITAFFWHDQIFTLKNAKKSCFSPWFVPKSSFLCYNPGVEGVQKRGVPDAHPCFELFVFRNLVVFSFVLLFTFISEEKDGTTHNQ